MQGHGKANRGNEPWFDTLVELLEPATPARLPHPEVPLEPATWRERVEARLHRLAPRLAAMGPLAERTSRGFEFALSGLVIAYLAMVTVDLTGERSGNRRAGPERALDRVAVVAPTPPSVRPEHAAEQRRRPPPPDRLEIPSLGGLQPLPDVPAAPAVRVAPLSRATRDSLLAALEADHSGLYARRAQIGLPHLPGRLDAAALREGAAADLELDAAAGRALAVVAAQERRASELEAHVRALRLAAAEAALERDRQSLAAAQRDGLIEPPARPLPRSALILSSPVEEAAAFAPYAPLPDGLTREPSRTVQVVRLRFTHELLAREEKRERERAAAAARKERREQAEEAARKRQEARKTAERQKRSRPKAAPPAAAPTPAPSWSTLFPTAQQ